MIKNAGGSRQLKKENGMESWIDGWMDSKTKQMLGCSGGLSLLREKNNFSSVLLKPFDSGPSHKMTQTYKFNPLLVRGDAQYHQRPKTITWSPCHLQSNCVAGLWKRKSYCKGQTAVVCLMLWKLMRVGEVGMDMALATLTRSAWLSCQRCQRFLAAERTYKERRRKKHHTYSILLSVFEHFCTHYRWQSAEFHEMQMEKANGTSIFFFFAFI